MSGEITIGNLLVVLSWLIAAAFFYRDLNWRVKNLETWRKEHGEIASQALHNMENIGKAVALQQQMAKTMDRRLQIIEDRENRYRRDRREAQ